MLYYKAWMESRSRFLIAASFMVLYCAFIMPRVAHLLTPTSSQHGRQASYAALIYGNVYSNAPVFFYLVFAILLGLGGISKERDKGTALYTLTLPVSRSRFLAVGFAVGLLELLALAILPALTIVVLTPITHHLYPLSQAIQFGMLWLPCGAVWFSIAFLLSSFTSREFVAQGMCIVLYFAYLIAAFSHNALPAFLDALRIMTGDRMSYFRSDLALIAGPLPWANLAGLLLASFVLLAAATQIVRQQDV
jgi:ABC-type transport system involved in multi-copper enzyme maturation permease subunit